MTEIVAPVLIGILQNIFWGWAIIFYQSPKVVFWTNWAFPLSSLFIVQHNHSTCLTAPKTFCFDFKSLNQHFKSLLFISFTSFGLELVCNKVSQDLASKSKRRYQRCFMKKGVFRNLPKFTGKHLCQSLFFNKVAGLRPAIIFKKRLWHRCFPVNFVNFLRTPFFQNTSGRLLLKMHFPIN